MSSSSPVSQSPPVDSALRGASTTEAGIPLPTYRTPAAHSRQQLTVSETAHALGVSVRVIHLRIKAGLIPAVKLVEKTTSPYLIDSAVVEYMAIQEADRRARKDAKLARRRAERDTRTAA